MINTLERNANTDRTDPAHPQKAHYTKSDARRRDQGTQHRLTRRESWRHHRGTLKTINNKIRTSAFSNSSMEICWKRRKEGRKRRFVRKGNKNLNVRKLQVYDRAQPWHLQVLIRSGHLKEFMHCGQCHSLEWHLLWNQICSMCHALFTQWATNLTSPPSKHKDSLVLAYKQENFNWVGSGANSPSYGFQK